MDLLLDSNNDIVFQNGEVTVATERVDVVAQRVKIRLLTFLGEWRFNTAYGVPYFQSIFGKKNQKKDIDAIFQQEILKEVGVRSIETFESTLVDRRYELSFSVVIDTGDISNVINIQPGV